MKHKRTWIVATVLVLLIISLSSGSAAVAAIVTVDTTSDDSDGDTSSIANLLADPGKDGKISLREAIEAANNSGGGTIEFDILPSDPGYDPVSKVWSISVTSPLPPLSGGSISIDGYTQTGAQEATDTHLAILKIVIEGSGAGGSTYGMRIWSVNNTIKGLVINQFQNFGIDISGTSAEYNIISGNYIGTDAEGGIDLGNGGGVWIYNSDNNTIGGSTPGDLNVISGNDGRGVRIGENATGNTVSGNNIGTNAKGTLEIGNTLEGVYIEQGSQDNTIGGTMIVNSNIISGNGGDGISILSNSTGNIISGNYIGIDVYGSNALGNNDSGVRIEGGAHHNFVGGNTDGERNIISSNGSNGVIVSGSGTYENTISGNYIGTDVSGSKALGNIDSGVYIKAGAFNNLIGGNTDGERNIISSNGSNGVSVSGSGTNGNTISGNYIGTDSIGTSPLGNAYSGVYIFIGAQNNTIGGSTVGELNVISGNDGHGVILNGSDITGNTVIGNYIGTDTNGTSALANASSGIFIYGGANNNTIGGSTVGERNVISGNGHNGVEIHGSGTSDNTILGNYIGIDSTGGSSLDNDRGVYIYGGASNNTIGGSTSGAGNIISGNSSDGVEVDGSSTTGNTISQNSIFSNYAKGIELNEDANGGIPAPVIDSTSVGSVNISGTACNNCTVEVFANSDTDGEGKTYIGTTTADPSGNFSITVSSLSNPYLTATATDSRGTSEFSEVFISTVREIFLPLVMR